MSLVTSVASIVLFDATFGVTVVASAMVALFVLAMVFLAVAPIVSSTWAEQLDSSSMERDLPESEDEADDGASGGAAGAAGAAAASTSASDPESASGPFTREELGKLVERADGKVIGTIAAAHGETATVEPRPDALDQILVRAGRKEIGDAFELGADSVREISSTRIHLASTFVRPAGEPTPETDTDVDDVSAAAE
jgi:hypothetical protein